eukprot:7222669-Ditylum_brightwellii.AAC.1
MAKAPNMVRTLTSAENTIEEALRQLATDTNVSYPAPPDITHGAGGGDCLEADDLRELIKQLELDPVAGLIDNLKEREGHQSPTGVDDFPMPVDDAYEKNLGSGRLSAGFTAALPGFADVLRAEGYSLQQSKEESAPLSAKEAAEMNHAIDAMIKAYEGATTATKS